MDPDEELAPPRASPKSLSASGGARKEDRRRARRSLPACAGPAACTLPPRAGGAVARGARGARRLEARRHLTRSGCRTPTPACASTPSSWRRRGAAARRPPRRPAEGRDPDVREPMLEPWGGELDVEATARQPPRQAVPGAGRLVVQRRVDRRHQVVLMVDTSLSMAGEKMALAAVAAAVLALKLRPGDLARGALRRRGACGPRLRGGGPAGRARPPHARAAVRRRHRHRGRARLGHAELQRGRDPGRCGLLVSDGVYTCGADPLPPPRASARCTCS